MKIVKTQIRKNVNNSVKLIKLRILITKLIMFALMTRQLMNIENIKILKIYNRNKLNIVKIRIEKNISNSVTIIEL